MVRCQRSIGSWCLFSKWCPCYCGKRQASVGYKYTLFPCIIPLSKGTFQTFGCLLSSFFLFHYISPSLSPTMLLHWNKTKPSNSCNNPFRRKQNFLYTTVVIVIFIVVICEPSMLLCYLNNVTKRTMNVYLVDTTTAKCSYLSAWEIVKWKWWTLIYFLKLIARLHCGGLERELCWLESAWGFVIRWVTRRELKQQDYFLSVSPNFTSMMVGLVEEF